MYQPGTVDNIIDKLEPKDAAHYLKFHPNLDVVREYVTIRRQVVGILEGYGGYLANVSTLMEPMRYIEPLFIRMKVIAAYHKEIARQEDRLRDTCRVFSKVLKFLVDSVQYKLDRERDVANKR